MINTDTIRHNIKHQMFRYDDTDILALCDEIDRLRAGAKPAPQQQERKMVKVRFPAKVDGKGEVIVNQYHRDNNGAEHHSVSSWPGAVTFWLTATLPIPEETEIEVGVE